MRAAHAAPAVSSRHGTNSFTHSRGCRRRVAEGQSKSQSNVVATAPALVDGQGASLGIMHHHSRLASLTRACPAPQRWTYGTSPPQQWQCVPDSMDAACKVQRMAIAFSHTSCNPLSTTSSSYPNPTETFHLCHRVAPWTGLARTITNNPRATVKPRHLARGPSWELSTAVNKSRSDRASPFNLLSRRLSRAKMSWGGGNNQDWDTVTFHKKTPTGKDATGNGALKAAMQQGAVIDTQMKCDAGREGRRGRLAKRKRHIQGRCSPSAETPKTRSEKKKPPASPAPDVTSARRTSALCFCCASASDMSLARSSCRRSSSATCRLHATVRYGTVRYGTARYGTARHGKARYGTARYGTA